MINIMQQRDLDNLKEIKVGEEFSIDSELELNHILKVYGKLIINKRLISEFYNNTYVKALGFANIIAYNFASVEAYNFASVKAYNSASIIAHDSVSVMAHDSASVKAFNSASVMASNSVSVMAYNSVSVIAYDDSVSVMAYDSVSVIAYNFASVIAYNSVSVMAYNSVSVKAHNSVNVMAYDSASVMAYDSASVIAYNSVNVRAYNSVNVRAYNSSSIIAYNSVIVRLFSIIKSLTMSGYSILIKDNSIKMKFKKSRTVLIQNIQPLSYLDREGIKVNNGKVILFKRVSKDFKTQENTINETTWIIGTTLTHSSWNPTSNECGEGKFHACSTPFFCDEFRTTKGDKYIAIEIIKKDLYEWNQPVYPHKIVFREGKVLYECDNNGVRI